MAVTHISQSFNLSLISAFPKKNHGFLSYQLSFLFLFYEHCIKNIRRNFLLYSLLTLKRIMTSRFPSRNNALELPVYYVVLSHER